MVSVAMSKSRYKNPVYSSFIFILNDSLNWRRISLFNKIYFCFLIMGIATSVHIHVEASDVGFLWCWSYRQL